MWPEYFLKWPLPFEFTGMLMVIKSSWRLAITSTCLEKQCCGLQPRQVGLLLLQQWSTNVSNAEMVNSCLLYIFDWESIFFTCFKEHCVNKLLTVSLKATINRDIQLSPMTFCIQNIGCTTELHNLIKSHCHMQHFWTLWIETWWVVWPDFW